MPAILKDLLLGVVGIILLNPLYDFFIKPIYKSYLGKRSEKQRIKNEQHKLFIQTVAKGVASYPAKRYHFYFNFQRALTEYYFKELINILMTITLFIVVMLKQNTTPLFSVQNVIGLYLGVILVFYWLLTPLLSRNPIVEVINGYEILHELRTNWDVEQFPVDDPEQPKNRKPK